MSSLTSAAFALGTSRYEYSSPCFVSRRDTHSCYLGKLADLLVVNGDPVKATTVLQDRANLDVVMKAGTFVECKLAPAKAAAKAA
jgi:hypothetical protein